MKNNISCKIKYISVLILLFCSSLIGFSQTSSHGTDKPGLDQSASWQIQYEPAKAFIENKGQFDIRDYFGKVLYAYDNGSTRILFTNHSVIFTFLKRWTKNENEKEELRMLKKAKTLEEYKEMEREEHRMNYETDLVDLTWENASAGVEVVAEDMTSDYHSYCLKDKKGNIQNINYIKAYKKLTYKNIYPKIDIEFVFHPVDGIKYSIILHPGADVSQIKMKYSGNLKIESNGDLRIATEFGDIIDHAPTAYYTGDNSSPIVTQFVKNEKTVSFDLSSHDLSRTVIIDPWVQTPALPNCNGVWECERDGAGNVYIIGGDMPMKLLKYNAAGVIQWTYNTPYDTANNWLGTFATDLAGNSYVTSGSIAAMQKINTGAGLVWNYNAPLFSVEEYWNIAFNCDQTKLIIGGTTGSMLNLMGAIFDINTSNGAINSTQIVGHGNMFGFPPSIQEVRSMTSCRNARYYFLTLDTIGCVDQNFSACSSTPTVFRINSGYNLGYKSENFRPNNGNSGLMHIRANRYFVYSQNGLVVDKRDLNTGAILTSGAIPGGIYNTVLFGGHQSGNSGIDIDSCGNVFVGSATCLVEYTSNLSQITAVATPYKIFDVAVSYGGNVIVCGATGDNSSTNRTGYVQSINMQACDPMTLYCCDANICPAGPICDTMPAFNLVANTPGGTWSGTGITNTALGTFDPAVAGAGTYTITYTLSCGSESIQITVLQCGSGCPTLQFSITNIVDVCAGQSNGSFTVTMLNGASPYDYTLMLGATTIATYNNVAGSQTFSGLAAGTYTLNVMDNNNCPGSITVTINTVANLTPTITGPSGICPGNSATLDAGAGYQNYLWSTTEITQTISVNSPGTYTVTVDNGAGCSGTDSFTLNQSSNPTPVITGNLSICSGTPTTLDAGGAFTSYLWSTSATSPMITVTSGGYYSVTVTDINGCTGYTGVTVVENNNVIIDFTADPVSGCAPLKVVFSYTPDPGILPNSWIWNFDDILSDTTTSMLEDPMHTYVSPGIYHVVLTATTTAGCIGNDSLTINVWPNPTADFLFHPTPVDMVDPNINFIDNSSYAAYWSWCFDDSLSGNHNFSILPDPVHEFSDSGTYFVMLIVSTEHGCTDTVIKPLVVFPELIFFIPNAFTPDGNGLNETFKPLISGIFEETYHMEIFDRWGKELYKTTDLETGWDGTDGNGKLCPSGVFVWIIHYTDLRGKEYKKLGHVTVVR